MKLYNILIGFVFAIVLASNVSALYIDAAWQDGSSHYTLTNGTSAWFEVDPSIIGSYSITVRMYDSNSDLVHDYGYVDHFGQIYNVLPFHYAHPGEYSITITGHDEVSSYTYTLYLTVEGGEIETNHAPTITPIANQEHDENSYYYYQVHASDEDGDSLTYSLVSSPSWLSISNSGRISGNTPNVDRDRSYGITVRVSDGTDYSDESYSLTILDSPVVVPDNNAPIINSLENAEVLENTYYSYAVSASDEDGDSLTYSFGDMAPSWLSINRNTGVISGVAPSVSSRTNYNVDVVVSDGRGGEDRSSYVITVLNSNEENGTYIMTVSSPLNGHYYNTNTINFRMSTNAFSNGWLVLDSILSTMGTLNHYDFNLTLGVLSEGQHRVVFHAINEEGSDISRTVTFYIDTIKPVVDITYPKEKEYDDITRIKYDVSDANLYECWYTLNAGTIHYVNCGEDILVNLDDDDYTLRVYAMDRAGNMDYDQVDFTIGRNGTHNDTIVNYNQEDEDLYLSQFGPHLPTLDLSEPNGKVTKSFWQVIWEAIVNFFEELF